jgi:hypothetical protein
LRAVCQKLFCTQEKYAPKTENLWFGAQYGSIRALCGGNSPALLAGCDYRKFRPYLKTIAHAGVCRDSRGPQETVALKCIAGRHDVNANQVFYWECGRRLTRLNKFHELLTLYFQHLPLPPQQLSQARSKINILMGDTHTSCELMGHHWTAQNGQGDLLVNTFNLSNLGIPHMMLIDALERTVGEYERQRRRLLWQLFNPFHWFDELLDGILFRVLTAFGMDTDTRNQASGES